jgi:hypothetical protein
MAIGYGEKTKVVKAKRLTDADIRRIHPVS